MSNPTVLVESFNGSLGGFTGVDPIRYDNGLWVEAAATNYVRDPRFGDSAWTAVRCTVAQDLTVTRESIPTGKLTVTDASGEVRAIHTTVAASFAPGDPARERVYLRCSAAGRSATVTLRAIDASTGEISTVATQTIALSTTGWAEFELGTASLPALTDRVRLYIVLTGVSNGDFVWVAQPQIAKATFLTSYGDGAMGTGYAWTSTADASASTRAASSASVATANHLDASSGSLAFRVTPQIETGVEEIWGEAGTKGAATDHLRWGRDATKHPYVEWSSNNAAYQRLTATETHDAGTEKFLYLGWSGVQTWLQVDDTAINVGTRAAPTGSLGAGNLILEAL